MNQFRKKPVVITAITFDQLVAHGIAAGGNVVNSMPWAFQYNGHPITHENDDCYIIPTLEGAMKMSRDDMLITGVKGEIYPCKVDIFNATYEPAPAQDQPVTTGVPPHQQRVMTEKMDRDLEISRLENFIRENPVFITLPTAEQTRLRRQLDVMHELSAVLGERIANF